MRDQARAFVHDQIPQPLRAHLPAALKVAYDSVKALERDSELLQIPSAQPGHLRAWSAELAVRGLIDSGKWPFDYDWQPYKNRTGYWLRVKLPHSTLSVSQVPDPSVTPREADYRTNAALNNEPFLDLPGFREEERVSGLPHLLLTHGHQELNFVQIGIPGPKSRSYIWRSPNILTDLHLVDDKRPAAEAADAEAVVELKEELVRWIRNNQ